MQSRRDFLKTAACAVAVAPVAVAAAESIDDGAPDGVTIPAVAAPPTQWWAGPGFLDRRFAPRRTTMADVQRMLERMPDYDDLEVRAARNPDNPSVVDVTVTYPVRMFTVSGTIEV